MQAATKETLNKVEAELEKLRVEYEKLGKEIKKSANSKKIFCLS